MALNRKIAVGTRADGQKGLFATEDVVQDEILLSLDGPVLDHPTRLSIQVDDHRHIEGTKESNAFLNHSCDPTAYVDWKGLSLRAKRGIKPPEEITCNYLTTDYEVQYPFLCRCGSPG